MRFRILSFLFLTLGIVSCAQESIPEVLKKLNKETVDYVSAEDLQELQNPFLLDTREKEEFEVSHLKGAIWVGYEGFDINKVLQKFSDKETPLVVYCSIGVRSEDVGEQLQKAGYTNVKNLYGGIFEWKNKEYPVYDENQQETEKIHAFSPYWGRFLTNGEKVYTPKTSTSPEWSSNNSDQIQFLKKKCVKSLHCLLVFPTIILASDNFEQSAIE